MRLHAPSPASAPPRSGRQPSRSVCRSRTRGPRPHA